MDVSGLILDKAVETPTKTRILAGSSTSVQQQVVRMDRNRSRHPGPDLRERLLAALEERLAEADVLLVSDYGHGTVDPGPLRSLRRNAGAKNQVAVVDSRQRLTEFAGMSAATPNLEEAAGALGRPVPDEDPAVAEAVVELRSRLEIDHLAITRGSRGMTILGPAAPPAHLPVFGSDQVADVTGAGDTVIAAFALALASGADTREASLLANVAAGLAVLKRGTATVSQEELRNALQEAAIGR
jgi:rfaE bifunctional protein kinase chain/domain